MLGKRITCLGEPREGEGVGICVGGFISVLNDVLFVYLFIYLRSNIHRAPPQPGPVSGMASDIDPTPVFRGITAPGTDSHDANNYANKC